MRTLPIPHLPHLFCASLTLLTLLACEGQPPKVPMSMETSAGSKEPATATVATPTNTAASQAPPTPAVSPPLKPAAAIPATATVATVGGISGRLTTTPAQAAEFGVVFLEGAPLVPGRGDHANVDNRQMAFIPFVQVVTMGGKVSFSNADPFPHNVFSPDNEKFNLGNIAAHGTATHVFKSAGEYSLLCNLHPNMLGYVIVSPSSYFARTNKKGEFKIADVPSGAYKITAWAPRQQRLTQAIVVAGTDVTSDFVLHR